MVSTPWALSPWPRLGPFRVTKTRSVEASFGRSSDQVLTQLGEEGVGDGHHPLVAALALGDEHRPFGHLDVRQPQSEHLTTAQAAQHHGEDHGPVPVGAHRTDQRVDVAGRQDLRQRARHPHQGHRPDPTTTPAGREPLRHRVRLDRGVAPGHQIRVEAGHRRQPPGDGPGRQSRLAIREPHHGAVASLVGQELEDIGRDHGDRVLVDDREERLQVEGDRPQRVRPRPSGHELEIGVDQRITQIEAGLSSR